MQFYKRHHKKKKKVLCDLYVGVDHETTIQVHTFFSVYLWFYFYSYINSN